MIVFISDNGARFIQTVEGADNPNFPLKGFKNTIYEGGARVPGFVHSPLLEKPRRRHQGLFHMVDFLPTLVNLAGGVVPSSLDGVDQWPSLSLAQPSPRTVVVYNIDDVFVPTLLAGPVIYQKFQIGLRGKRYIDIVYSSHHRIFLDLLLIQYMTNSTNLQIVRRQCCQQVQVDLGSEQHAPQGL